MVFFAELLPRAMKYLSEVSNFISSDMISLLICLVVGNISV